METTTMKRANKVTIATIDNVITATFFKTHIKIGTVTVNDVKTWKSDKYANKTAEREAFRQYVCKNADKFGIEWSPEDQRTPANTRVASYFSDEILEIDVKSLLQHDVRYLVEECGQQIDSYEVVVDEIVPVTKTEKGYDLLKMGVEFGKYCKNGNWAWANIQATLTMKIGEDEIYYPMEVKLVSGQLKKPHITKTDFNKSVAESIEEIKNTKKGNEEA